MKGEILLIRHSLTEANEKLQYCGRTDMALSPKGIALANEIAQTDKYKVKLNCKFFSSGMKRTDETLAILFGAVGFEPLPGLREMDFGVFEMLSYEELKDRRDYKGWITGDNSKNICPGGESAVEMGNRVLRAFESVLRYPDAVVVTHGGVIAAIMAHYFPHEEKNRYQ